MSGIIARASGIPAARLCREKEMLELQQGQWGKEGLGMGRTWGENPMEQQGKSRNLFAEGLGEWAIMSWRANVHYIQLCPCPALHPAVP